MRFEGDTVQPPLRMAANPPTCEECGKELTEGDKTESSACSSRTESSACSSTETLGTSRAKRARPEVMLDVKLNGARITLRLRDENELATPRPR